MSRLIMSIIAKSGANLAACSLLTVDPPADLFDEPCQTGFPACGAQSHVPFGIEYDAVVMIGPVLPPLMSYAVEQK